ncbi:MAG: hypothetical protein CL608_02295 [Anaerolineaceae bacterium]|nr:hypothetical protein [Anaerolineaceae bacterium]
MTEQETFGRYQIKAKLGQGGMGSVYHAYDPNFRRDVALKLLDKRLTHDKKFQRRFEREARAVAKIDHPGIVPIYDFGEDEGALFLVMPLMEGGTLGKRLENGLLSVEEATSILKQIAPALDMTHRLNMVHRDLKPDNILFDRYGVPRVADFGIVKSAEGSMTLTAGALIGTPAYMSPEQVSSKDTIDGRSDIYSLGIILFQMLTGKRPFDADTPLALALKHVMEQPPSILDTNPELPVGCESILRKALQKEPDKRYQTVAALVADLERVESLPLSGAIGPDESPPLPPTEILPIEPPEVPATRRRFPVLPAVGGLLLIIVVAAFFLLRGGDEDPTPNVAVPAAAVVADTTTPTATAVPPTATTAPTDTAVPPSPTVEPLPELPTSTPTATATPAPVATVITTDNIQNLAETMQLAASSEALNSVTVSPDGSRLAAATSAGITLYQLPDFAPLETIVEGTVGEITWSPDGRFLAGSGPNQAIHVWNSSDGSEVAQLAGSAVALAWSPDSSQLLLGSANGQVSLWPIEQDAVANSWNDHTGPISQIAWSPDGSRFASGSGSSTVWFRSVAGTGDEGNSFRQNGVHGLAWSPDGSRLATAGADGTVRLETVSNGQLQTLNCSGGDPISIVWLDENTVATGSEDGQIRVCNVNERQPLLTFGNQAGVPRLFWLPGSNQLLSLGGRDGTIGLWARADGEQTAFLNRYTQYREATSVSWSPDNTQLAVGTVESTILIWSVAEQRIVRVLGGHDGGVKTVVWSPDGELIASNGTSDELVRVWEASSGRMVQSFAGHDGLVTAVTWSADSTVVASSSHDSTLKLWNVNSGSEVRSFSVNALGQVLFVARSPNGEEMVATGNTSLVQLRPPDNTRLSVTLNAHDAPVNAVAWSSDSARFATGDNSGRILLWNFPVGDNGQPALNWNTQIAVRGLAFSPDDTILAAVVGGNGRFYETTSGTEVGTPITLHPRSSNIAWSADGLMLAGVGGDGLVRVWQVLERP